MTEKGSNSAGNETNELSSKYLAETLEKLGSLEETFGDHADFMMLKMAIEQGELKPGCELNINVKGMTLVIAPTDTAEDIREKLDRFLAPSESQTQAIIKAVREKGDAAIKLTFQEKSGWQADDCINKSPQYNCPNESTLEAVCTDGKNTYPHIRCCTDEKCKAEAAKRARASLAQ